MKTGLKKGIVLIMLALVSSISTVAKAGESSMVLIWGNESMELTLPVGSERLIEFPQPLIDFQVPQYLGGAPYGRITVLPDGRVFWMAFRPWDAVRVQAIGADGEVYLLDIGSSEVNADTTPLKIVKSTEVDPESISKTIQAKIPRDGYDYIDLARLAAQNIYGPRRLIKSLPGVTRIPILHETVDIYRYAGIKATPVAQWRSERPKYFVTAVELVNTTRSDINIDPRLFRGDWLFAVPHTDSILPFGYYGDTSHVYLVSNKPFGRAVGRATLNRTAYSETPAKVVNE